MKIIKPEKCYKCGGEARFKFLGAHNVKDIEGKPYCAKILFTIQCEHCGESVPGIYSIEIKITECGGVERNNMQEFERAVHDWNKKNGAIDWDNVNVDTPIYVKDRIDRGWNKRHFAKYEDGTVFAWSNGCTSFSTSNVRKWNYAKLAEDEGKEER